MKSRLSSHERSFLLFVFLGLEFGAIVSANTKDLTQDGSRSGTQSKDASITVTGCLTDADGEHLFSITGKDGGNYLLKSSKVILKDHVGHKVAVTGTIKDDDDEDMNVEYRESGARLLIVSGLKMINTNCK